MVGREEKASKAPGLHPGAALGSGRPGWPSPDSQRPSGSVPWSQLLCLPWSWPGGGDTGGRALTKVTKLPEGREALPAAEDHFQGPLPGSGGHSGWVSPKVSI